VPLVVLPAHDCSYLPGRKSISRAFMVGDMPGEIYHRFMDAGFRRSGKLLYQPICRGCRACQPIRVPVARFAPSKSQRRCRRKNEDVVVSLGEPKATDEKYALYLRFLAGRFGRRTGDETGESFSSFLYESPVETLEFTYRDSGGRLLAAGICDVCRESLSSVYFYYDPAEARRGLGTFGALTELETADALGIPYYYLGYWVAGCDTMAYKSSFRPYELLCSDGVWRAGGGVTALTPDLSPEATVE
jgi:arginine-tRNA-protein transferase